MASRIFADEYIYYSKAHYAGTQIESAGRQP